ncbi:MAG: hypothetical protein WA089_11820 [Anaerolineae bacterium]
MTPPNRYVRNGQLHGYIKYGFMVNADDFFFSLQQICAQAGPLSWATVRVGAEDIALAAAPVALHQRLLRPLSHLQQPSASATTLTLTLVAAAADAPPFPWPDAPQAGDFWEFRTGDYLFSHYGHGLAVVGLDLRRGCAVGYVRRPELLPAAFFSGLLFTTLYQALRPRGFFLLHAAALAWQGQGVLITGPSGAGKTTTMLQCVRAGFRFVSDDATLLTRAAQGDILAVATLNTMHVTPRTVDFFPELAPFVNERADNGKATIFLPEVYPDSMSAVNSREAVAPVRLLIVPSLQGPRDGTFEPLSGRTVLSEALPLSVDLQQPAAAAAHLDLLAQLVKQARCFRLHLPPDVVSVPPLLAARLAHLSLDELR